MPHFASLSISAPLGIPELPSTAEQSDNPQLPLTAADYITGEFKEVTQAGVNLRAVLDALSEPVIIVNDVGRIIFSNKRARLVLAGRSAPGTVNADLPSAGPWTRLHGLLRSARNGLRPMQHETVEVGAGQQWRLIVQRLSVGSAGASYFLVHLRDETEIRRLQHSLRTNEALAHTGSVLAGSAHQAKNVLFGITSSLEALRHKHRDRLENDPILQNLSDAIARLQTMLRDLFDLSGSRHEERALLSADAVMMDAIDCCAPIAQERSVEIASRREQSISMYGAARLLTRALENVIDNAVRHSPRSARILVEQRLAPEGPNWLQYKISDCGPGFPASDMERLLDPFFTTRPGGTGLGLAVARRVIEDHGGKLELSNGTSGGAVVKILLPLDRRGPNHDYPSALSGLN